MTKLIDSFIHKILLQIKSKKTSLIRLEGIDDIEIYYHICKYFSVLSELDNCIIKLTKEKYDEFCAKSSNHVALNFFLQGKNAVLDEPVTDSYRINSYVDYDNAITKYRNQAPENEDDKTVLILLLGTEEAQDEGSLSETSYLITPQEIIDDLRVDYSKWFESLLVENSIKTDAVLKSINTIYKALFSDFNTDIVKLSAFIEDSSNLSFSTGQEFIDHIFETLRDYWNIMSIKDIKYIPKISKLQTEKASAIKILKDDIKFITSSEDIPSKSAIDKIIKKMSKFVDENSINKDAPFPEYESVFSNFEHFQGTIINYLNGKNLDENRELLKKLDYSIIHQIMGAKLPRVSSEKPKTITGEPIEAYSKMFFDSTVQFNEMYKELPNNIQIRVNKIVLSNCLKEDPSNAFSHICNFLGGILAFFNNSDIEVNEELMQFSYMNDEITDCFDYQNYQKMLPLIKTTGKWGEPSKIQFTIKVCNENNYHNFDYTWTFSPYSAWNNAFSYLTNIVLKDSDSSLFEIPTMVVCHNIQSFLSCESEEEFFSNLDQIDEEMIYDQYRKEIRHYFKDTRLYSKFQLLCSEFNKFANTLAHHGFFGALGELEKCVSTYSAFMDEICENYDSYSGVQKERIPLLANCFLITSNHSIIENHDISQAILPAYHPVMLEKIEAKEQFIRSGFAELLSKYFSGTISNKNLNSVFDQLIQLSSITQGADALYQKNNDYLPCKQMWEYYGVYYGNESLDNIISSNSFGMSVVTDDDDSKAILKFTPESSVLVRNIMDYIRTFPACVDGLKIAFIAPSDMQHIVSAMHHISKELEKTYTNATINIELICMNSKKNSTAYLKRWLDNFFVDERTITINTFLKYLSVNRVSDIEQLRQYISGFDICFTYNILEPSHIQFDYSTIDEIDKDQPKFPMTLIPDTTAISHGQSRRINVSQFQFLASKAHTQAIHKIGYPANMAGSYRVFNTLSMNNIQKDVVRTAHECCKWVVCIDPAIDKKMLESDRSNAKIIGFTTGEGNYGELNVTVSARKDILVDIKKLLQKRLHEKFPNWDNERLELASKHCVDDLSETMDGSRILKALNPYDFEIHSFLAYVLTLQFLGFSQDNNDQIVRSLISLDSYKHWFAGDDNMRPDFMLLEIPKTADNLDPCKDLQIRIKIIECKMGFANEQHIDKATQQLKKGLSIMSDHWSPKSSEVMHRYWLNQLYRAIIFSPINLPDNSDEYSIIREKIYTIIDGKIDISWSGDVFAFWLDYNSDSLDETDVSFEFRNDSCVADDKIDKVIIHEFGQMYIQKMLLPSEKRSDLFEYNPIEENASEVMNEESGYEQDDIRVDVHLVGSSIPSASKVYVPFLLYLQTLSDHTRQSCLDWFAHYFRISEEDKRIVYESNNHYKWETVLDSVITLFRKHGIIENSQIGVFHITALGYRIAQRQDLESVDFVKLIESTIETEKSVSPITLDNENQSLEVPVNHEELKKQPESFTIQNNRHNDLSSIRFLLGEDLRTKEKYYWEFGNKELNNRHLLINGNSGCGKTYCIQSLLMEASLNHVSSVVFDYTGGFAPSKLEPLFKKALDNRIEQRFVRKDKIPVNPFKKQLIRMDEDFAYPEEDADVARKIADIFKSVYKSFGDQQFACMYDAILNGLRKKGENMDFNTMVSELDALGNSRANTVLSKLRPFTDLNCFVKDDAFSWESIRNADGKVYIFQLAGYDRDTQILLTEFLLWDIWNFCAQDGDEKRPIILVMDEAQNLSHQENTPSAKILTEGRKFGISGWYATQFMKPQLDDAEIQRLQQAGQKLYFCPPDEGVMTVAKNIDISAQRSKEWAERLKKLKKGECVTCGNMVRNGRWTKYEPKIIRISSLQERLSDDNTFTD